MIGGTYFATAAMIRFVAIDGAARRLVVEPGDLMSAAGRYVRFDDDDWLDLAQVHDLVGRRGPWKSPRSVRLEGIDASAIPTGPDWDRSGIPGYVRVKGVWGEDVIRVDSQEPVPLAARERFPQVTLPAPSGGWDASSQSKDVAGLEELRASGLIVRDGWIRHTGGTLVLRVAASDVAAVEAVLAPQLPRRLYTVGSSYTAGQLREVEEVFDAHHRLWDFEIWSYQSLDAQCQPYADVGLMRVSRDLADWADTLPAGLLTLRPTMTPA